MNFKNIFSKKKSKKILFFEADLEGARALKAEINLTEKSAELEKLFNFESSEKDFLISADIIKFIGEAISAQTRSNTLSLVLGRPFLKSGFFEFVFDRENPEKVVDETELENFLRTATEKVINTEIPKASRFFSDKPTVLANSRVAELKIDGRPVMNPVGFSGRRLRINLENIYAEKDFWVNLGNILKTRRCQIDSLTDRTLNMDKVFLSLGEEGILIEITEGRTKIGLLGESSYRSGGLNWGWKRMREAIMKNLALSYNQAEIIRRQYASGEISKYAGDWFDKILKEEMQILTNGVLAKLKSFSRKDISPAVYFSGNDPMLSIVLKSFEKISWGKQVFSKKPAILIYPKREIFDKMCIKVEGVENIEEKDLSLALTLSLANQFMVKPDFFPLNKTLKRSARWFQ